ncbi:uncharacterized protein LAESUDRAFT_760072 [Laetiporus sulphureus 93-53]|uniref:Uncharacterized protein n=1 Tax=Laetiporus sulphureus 93-53 TaxID=1314785 RepID=A0A165DS38_9APHY|nr:uncharacterized protein LAESUDRAFT_760072 [Laetiporus sulphureus 93-53]KZT05515.1 hypothetical protein LAESUDRAFT_760072 [Laetiporus sulphureus 93-53]
MGQTSSVLLVLVMFGHLFSTSLGQTNATEDDAAMLAAPAPDITSSADGLSSLSNAAYAVFYILVIAVMLFVIGCVVALTAVILGYFWQEYLKPHLPLWPLKQCFYRCGARLVKAAEDRDIESAPLCDDDELSASTCMARPSYSHLAPGKPFIVASRTTQINSQRH